MIRVESFTPLGIPLYAALLLLMAFGVMRRPGVIKPDTEILRGGNEHDLKFA